MKTDLYLSEQPARANVYHYEDLDVSVRLIIPALLGNDYFSSPLEENNQFRSFVLQKVQLEEVKHHHKARPAVRYAHLFYSLASFKERIFNMNDFSEETTERKLCTITRNV